MGGLTLLEALTGGAFDRLIWQHSGEFDQNFSKKSNARSLPGGGGMGGFGIDWYINKVCQDPFPSSTEQQISSTFVKELNILRCFVFLVLNVSEEFLVWILLYLCLLN